MNITCVLGDITGQHDVCAIVNAAKPSLLGGSGIDGAIHRAAGPGLRAACFMLPIVPEAQLSLRTRRVANRTSGPSSDVRCPVGEARATSAFDLPMRFVIHTVGPIYDAADSLGCEMMLETAYKQSLLLAQMLGCRIVALPAISAGIFGYPLEQVAKIAVRVATDPCWHFDEIRFVLFSQDVYDAFAIEVQKQPETA